jgi:hypothetical protein
MPFPLDAVLLEEGDLLGRGSVVVCLHAQLGIRIVGPKAAAEHLHRTCLQNPAHHKRGNGQDAFRRSSQAIPQQGSGTLFDKEIYALGGELGVVGDGLGRALVSCYCGVHSSLADEATRLEGELRPVSESDSQGPRATLRDGAGQRFIFPQRCLICKRQGW